MIPRVLLLPALLLLMGACTGPRAAFSVSGDTRAPATLTFTNESTHADSYQWFLGGEELKDAAPTFTFERAGNYLVQLVAQKGKKTATAYQRVIVEGPEDCLVRIETPYGDMLVQLHHATPDHQANFLKLAEEGFYDSLLFHRVIQGFMIQGGDPNSRGAGPNERLGSGGPGYTLPAEMVDTLVHVKGALAAARTGDQVNPERRSSGSQFYIVQGRPTTKAALETIAARGGFTYAPAQQELYQELGGTPFLDQNYTVFGQVIKGLEVIDKIAAQPVGAADRPREAVPMKISVVDYFVDKKLNP